MKPGTDASPLPPVYSSKNESESVIRPIRKNHEPVCPRNPPFTHGGQTMPGGLQERHCASPASQLLSLFKGVPNMSDEAATNGGNPPPSTSDQASEKVGQDPLA